MAMSKEEKKLNKIYFSTEDEEIKKLLSTLFEDKDDEEDTKKTEEPKETEVPKEETKVEEKPKEETKEFDFDGFKKEIIGEFEKKFQDYSSKLEEFKVKFDEEIPKAKDFGANSKNVPSEEQNFEKQGEEIIGSLNKKTL